MSPSNSSPTKTRVKWYYMTQFGHFLADRTNGRAYATVLRLSYMRNRLASKWMTLTSV